MALTTRESVRLIAILKAEGKSTDDILAVVEQAQMRLQKLDKKIRDDLLAAVGSGLTEMSMEPDGVGFYYGQLQLPAGRQKADSGHGRLDVLPPHGLFTGDAMMDGYRPDIRDWIAYLDGEEIARARTHEGLGEAVKAWLEKPDRA